MTHSRNPIEIKVLYIVDKLPPLKRPRAGRDWKAIAETLPVAPQWAAIAEDAHANQNAANWKRRASASGVEIVARGTVIYARRAA